MESPVPRPDIPSQKRRRGNAIAYVWIALAFVALIAAIAFVVLRTERNTRECATTQAQTPPPPAEEGSDLIEFTPADVKINTGWSLLAGSHPTVTFTCRLSSAAQSAKLAVLCYRPLGASEWLTVETRPRRDRTCRVTLRDLTRNMPYECLFIVRTPDTILRSSVVGFTTSPQN